MRDDDGYRVHLNAGSGQAPDEVEPLADVLQPVSATPFCLGILGDFSGREGLREADNRPDLSSRRLVRVTPDNVLTFAGLTPSVRLGGFEGTWGPEEIGLSSFDDFHPDHLFDHLAALRPFRVSRQLLLEGKEGMNGAVPSGAGPEPMDPARQGEPKPSPAAGLLDAVLDETREEMSAGGTGIDDDLDGFIRRVIRPHVVASGPDRSAELQALDSRASEIMNQVLHDPGFQAMESLWRSVVFLLSRIEVSTKLRIYLIDVSKSDLESDLLGTDEPSDWSLGGLFVNPVSENGEALRWAGLLGAYPFGEEATDLPLLQRIGFLAEAAEVPWISAGDSSLFGCGSMEATPEPRDWIDPLDPLWNQLRENPEAAWICLAFPGFLLRSAYGPGGGKVKSLDFRESVDEYLSFLWGNPAFLCGIELANAFARAGWGLRLGSSFRVENLPVFTTSDGSASTVQASLSHSAAAQVAEAGLIPILGSRNDPGVRVQGIRSISTKENKLRAWWMGHP